MGVASRVFIKSWYFFKLKELGSGTRWLILSVNNVERLYAGSFHQFTTGRMG